MISLKPLNKVALLLVSSLAAQTMFAQSAFTPALRFSAGKVRGGYNDVVATKMVLGFAVEVGYRLNANASVIGQLGYSQAPGDSVLVVRSPIGATGGFSLPATGVNPSVYETRLRKTDVNGFNLGALYRHELPEWGCYVQGGVRIQMNKTTVTDTGTLWTTNGLAATSQTSANIIGVTTIAEQSHKKSTSIAPVVGVGYFFNSTNLIELNLLTVKADNPTFTAPALNSRTDYKKNFSGWGVEIAYSIRL